MAPSHTNIQQHLSKSSIIPKPNLRSNNQLVVMLDWDNTIMGSASFFLEVLQDTADRLKDQKIELRTTIPSIATKKKEDILKELFGDENLSKVLPVFQKVYDERFKPKET